MRMWERLYFSFRWRCTPPARPARRKADLPAGRGQNASRSSPLCCGRLSQRHIMANSAGAESCGIPRGRQCPRTESRKSGKSSRCGSSVCRKLSSWLAREGGCVNEKRLRQADREISVIPMWPLPRLRILCCRIRRSACGTRMIVSDGKVSVCVISSPFASITGNAGKSHGRTEVSQRRYCSLKEMRR